MVRSWLDVEVDLQLSSASILKSPQEINDESTGGPELWPQPVVYQQPRDLHSLFQKLLTGYQISNFFKHFYWDVYFVVYVQSTN